MRVLFLSLLLIGCGTSTSTPPQVQTNDGGTNDSQTPGDKPCLGDGWCIDITGTGSLTDVWASAPDDVWAVAPDRKLLRFDGNTWNTSTVPGDSAAYAIWGRAKNDVYVTLENSLAHFDGSNWTNESVVPPASLYRIAADESGALWGLDGRDGVYRREGSAWVAKLPATSSGLIMNSMAGCGGKLWIAAGQMVEWDGTTFFLHGISSNDDAVNGAGVYPGGVWISSRVLHRVAGGAFRANLLEAAPRGLFAMSVGTDGKAFGVGEGNVVGSYDGTKWTKLPSITTTDIRDVLYVSPTVVRVMKSNGAILEWDLATSTSKIIAEVAFLTIVGPNTSMSWSREGDAFYNEGGKLWRFREGTGVKWSSIGSTDDAVRRIWGESNTSVWIAGGQKLRRWNGTSVSEVTTGIALETGEAYLDVGGSGGSDVWVVTSKRNLRFDGTSWKAFASGFSDADTRARVVSVAPNDTWIFRGVARYAHFDGTSFKPEAESKTTEWVSCSLAITRAPGEIYAGAPPALTKVSDTYPNEWFAQDVCFNDTGKAWMLGKDTADKHQFQYFDGAKLHESIDAPSLSGWNSIWALPSGEAWAVGSAGVLHRKP